MQLPISLILALILARGVKGERFYVSVYFIPVLISTVVIGQLWMKIYNPQYGLLNTVLRSMGLEQLTGNWLGDTKKVIFAVIVPVLWQYIGYHMLLMYASVRSISEEIFEAARIDGAGYKDMLKSIIMPLMMPAFTIGLFLSISNSFKMFDQNLALTQGGPYKSTEMLALNIYNSAFGANEFGFAQAKAIIFMIVVAAIGVTQLVLTKRKEVEM